MQLHFSHPSPFARKVRVVLHETGLAGRCTLVPADPWSADPALLRLNPLSRIPTLVTDDGTAWLDSPLICEVLDGLHDGPKLIPAEPDARLRALRLQAVADGVMDAGVLRLAELRRRPADKQWDWWLERQQGVMARGLDALEAEAAALDGPLTVGQIAVGVCLGWLDFRFDADGWREGRPGLASWYAAFAARRSMQETMPKEAS